MIACITSKRETERERESCRIWAGHMGSFAPPSLVGLLVHDLTHNPDGKGVQIIGKKLLHHMAQQSSRPASLTIMQLKPQITFCIVKNIFISDYSVFITYCFLLMYVVFSMKKSNDKSFHNIWMASLDECIT